MLKFPQRHPWWTTLIGTVVLIVGFGLYQFIDWTGGKPNLTPSRETTYLLGPIDDEGYIQYDVALNNIMSEGITPETNANVMLWQALGPHPEGASMPPGYFEALGMAEPSKVGYYIVPLHRYLRTAAEPTDEEITLHKNKVNVAKARPWDKKEFPVLARWIEANTTPLDVVVEGVKRPHYFNPLIAHGSLALSGALISNVRLCREVAQLLVVRAMLRLHQGETDAAWNDILACHRLGRHIGNSSSISENLVGYAIETIARNAAIVYAQSDQITATKLRVCLTELQNLRLFRPVHDLFDVSQRIIELSNAEALHQGLATDPTMPSREIFELAEMMRHLNIWFDKCVIITRFDMDQPLPRGRPYKLESISIRRPRFAKLQGYMGSPRQRGNELARRFISEFMVAQYKVMNSNPRTVQAARIERLAFALAIYKKETGHYPQQLAELVPEIIVKPPIDLFSTEPLHYKRTAAGYTLYSVGVNGIDDNGQRLNNQSQGDDLIVTVPIPNENE